MKYHRFILLQSINEIVRAINYEYDMIRVLQWFNCLQKRGLNQMYFFVSNITTWYRKFTLLSSSKIIFKQNVSAVLIGCRQFVLFVLGSTFVNCVWWTLNILNTDSHTTINGFNEILIYFQKLSYCNEIDSLKLH